jgi:hypothetical protein
MTTREPELRWYQFSLRSLFLLTAFGAVLCSIGVRMHWLVSAAVGTLAFAGVTGRIVAGTRLDFVQGVIFGALFLIAVVPLCGFLLLLTGLPWLLWPHGSWLLFVVLLVVGIAVLVGGGVGGFTVRPRSER